MSTGMVPASDNTSISVLPKSSEIAPDKYGDDAFDNLAKIGDYLAYLQLVGAGSNTAKKEQAKAGHHALYKGKQILDLGKNINCWICAWRPIALLTAGEKPVAFFDPTSVGFIKVREEAAKPGMNGAMCGPQFLVYLPDYGFATYMMASKTAKNEAPNFKALIDKCAIISSKLIETKKYSWFGPTVVAASTQFDVPDIEEYTNTVRDFKSPKETQVELADTQAGQAREM